MTLLLLNSGCIELFEKEKGGHFTSHVNLNNTQLNPIITQEMIDFIGNYYLSSKTTFYFQLDSSAYSQGITIENALRNAGYGVSYIEKDERIPFAYKIDFIDQNIMRATYNIGTSTLSRLYSIEGENISPLSAFTKRGFKKPIYHTPLKELTSTPSLPEAETYPLINTTFSSDIDVESTIINEGEVL